MLWPVSAGSSLFVRNQTAPDEGYIRHALSFFPTITTWSWTTTISVPCLPLGYIDPAYVSQYCHWPRGAPMSNLCPPHSIFTVRVTLVYLLDILRPHPIYKAFSSFDLPASPSSGKRYVPTKCPFWYVWFLAVHDSLYFWYRIPPPEGCLVLVVLVLPTSFFFFSGVDSEIGFQEEQARDWHSRSLPFS